MKKRIFVVDDDSSIRDYLFTFLSIRGYYVECFENGQQMLNRLASNGAPGLLLLDVLMPGSDGIELLEKVRASGSSVPVIMLSGASHIRTVVESMKMGALDFLLKPFDEGVLKSTIKDVLERPEGMVDRSHTVPIVHAGDDG